MTRMSDISPINCEPLKALIRTVPDFPKPGILFYDITTLLKDKTGFAQLIDAFARTTSARRSTSSSASKPAASSSAPRSPIASTPASSPSASPKSSPPPPPRVKLRPRVRHRLAAKSTSTPSEPGQRVIIVDDLLATGGTMQATVQLVEQLGGEIAGLGFAIELDFLKGRAKFPEYDVFSLLHYNE